MKEKKTNHDDQIGCNQSPDIQLNLNVRGLQPSATVAINEYANRLMKEGKEIFKMGLGQSPFPVPRPLVEALKKNAHQKEYLPVKGLPELREAVAEHHRRIFGIKTAARDVLIGPGSKELMFIMQLVYYGDLIIPIPTWVSYAPQARIIGRQIHLLPTTRENGWKLLPEQIDRLFSKDPSRPRILILNYPSNPTGTSYTATELSDISEVARKYRVILLSDEIYGKLHHEGNHTSIVPMYPAGSIFSGGLSKWCGAGGWRLGLFVFPECLRWLQDAMAVVASETFTSTSAPIQYAAVPAFHENDEIDRVVAHSQRILGALGKLLTSLLSDAGVSIVPPQGGFYLFPDFSAFAGKLRSRGITTSVEFCEQLLNDTGIAILPGSAFGQPVEELTARIAYINFDGKKALEAACQLSPTIPLDEKYLRNHCSEPIRAIERLTDWLNQ